MGEVSKEQKVIALIGEEGISLRKSCEIVGVKVATFLLHVERDGLGEHYARAMKARADMMFEEMLEIADTPVQEKIEVVGDEFSSITTKDALQHRKLQVDTRKWILSRMNPQKYGDRVEQVITTGKSLPPWVTGEPNE